MIKLTIEIDPHPRTTPETVARMRRQLPEVLKKDMTTLFKHCVQEADWDGHDPEVRVEVVS
jgi:hypothetical protein